MFMTLNIGPFILHKLCQYVTLLHCDWLESVPSWLDSIVWEFHLVELNESVSLIMALNTCLYMWPLGCWALMGYYVCVILAGWLVGLVVLAGELVETQWLIDSDWYNAPPPTCNNKKVKYVRKSEQTIFKKSI